jgi:hypothetical protein
MQDMIEMGFQSEAKPEIMYQGARPENKIIRGPERKIA